MATASGGAEAALSGVRPLDCCASRASGAALRSFMTCVVARGSPTDAGASAGLFAHPSVSIR